MNTVLAAILACSIVLIQCLIGGTRLVFSLPVYGLLAVGAILTVFRGPRRDALPRPECLLVSVLFFAYILGRAAYSPVGYLWWTDFYMVLGCLAAYFLTAYYITDSRSRTIVLIALFSLVAFEVLVGLRQFTVGDNWMPFSLLKGGGLSRRASGTLISPIHLAGYLEAVGVLALSFALWSTWKMWARILSGYVAVLCWVGGGDYREPGRVSECCWIAYGFCGTQFVRGAQSASESIWHGSGRHRGACYDQSRRRRHIDEPEPDASSPGGPSLETVRAEGAERRADLQLAGGARSIPRGSGVGDRGGFSSLLRSVVPAAPDPSRSHPCAQRLPGAACGVWSRRCSRNGRIPRLSHPERDAWPEMDSR